jgi:4-hydroxyphenylacetate decarboxylase large subunit
LQLTEIIHIAVVNEDAISGMSVGRLGQVLYPWFEQDIAAGRITEDQVIELLEQDRVMKTSIDPFASTGVVSGELSGNSFNTLSVGGVNSNGDSAVNRLEYLILQAAARNAMPQSTIALHYDEKLPESRAWSIGGCLETQPGCWKTLTLNGKQYEIPGGACQPTSVGIHFVAMPKVLELTLFNGVDQRTKEQVYPAHNREFLAYDDVWEQFKQYWQLTCRVLERCNNLQHDIWRKNNMAIFNSMLKPDCLDSGHLINELGYRYNATYNVESCGTANFVNSMAALKKQVFDDHNYTLGEIKLAIQDNFGFKTAHEINSFSLRDQQKRDAGETTYDQMHFDLLQAPKYGNDDPYVDQILKTWEDWFCSDCHNYKSLYGLPVYACQISVSTHGAQGSATMATPDGRLSGTTYADASMSAYPGTDRMPCELIMTVIGS